MSEVTLADLGYEGGTKVLATTGGASGYQNGKLEKGVPTSIEERALVLLGSGVTAESVASALGVTPGRISQLLAEEAFAAKVSTLRYENMQQHNARDNRYDSLEDSLLDKMEAALPLMLRPAEILKALAITNSAKRRGQSSPDQVVNQQNIVTLVLPTIITQKFAVNIDNQVIRAGDQELHTMPAANLLRDVEEAAARREEIHSHLEAPLTKEGLMIEAL